MTAKKARVAAQVLLFVMAVIVFYLGLGLGLQFNPTLGTILWLVAGALVALNLLWIVRPRA